MNIKIIFFMVSLFTLNISLAAEEELTLSSQHSFFTVGFEKIVANALKQKGVDVNHERPSSARSWNKSNSVEADGELFRIAGADQRWKNIVIASEVSKPEYLVFALLQSRADPQYVKPIQKWFIKLYTEALSRMGITFRYRSLPPSRASLYSDQGIVDGELSRVSDYNSKHPNLIRVEEHHLQSVFSAFATDPAITLNGWQSLKKTNYRVEYRKGIAKCAENLIPIIPSERLSEIHSIQGGVGKLLLGRTDIFIEPEDGVFDYLKTEQFQRRSQGRAIYKVGIMETITSHLWLHKKHRGLAPQLSVILRDMKKEGLFDLYLEQVGLSPLEIKW